MNLKEFFRNFNHNKKLCVLIVSPGISDETFSNEQKLVKLSRLLSKITNIKILFRRKPVENEIKFKNFYYDAFKNCKNIVLTPHHIK